MPSGARGQHNYRPAGALNYNEARPRDSRYLDLPDCRPTNPFTSRYHSYSFLENIKSGFILGKKSMMCMLNVYVLYFRIKKYMKCSSIVRCEDRRSSRVVRFNLRDVTRIAAVAWLIGERQLECPANCRASVSFLRAPNQNNMTFSGKYH